MRNNAAIDERNVFIRACREALVAGTIGLTSCGIITIGFASVVWSETGQSSFSENLLSGQVTAVRSGALQIDNKDYPVSPDVMIKDDEARERSLKDIEPGAVVQIHLKQGRVDSLIIILPK